jgi:hypothetical protein
MKCGENAMKTVPWKKLVIVLVIVLFVALGIIVRSVRGFHEHQANSAKDYWQKQADQIATPSLTPEAARQWLLENGFKVWSFGKAREDHQTGKGETVTEEFFSVDGSMQLDQGGWLHDQTWLDLGFDFEGKALKRVRAMVWPGLAQEPIKRTATALQAAKDPRRPPWVPGP